VDSIRGLDLINQLLIAMVSMKRIALFAIACLFSLTLQSSAWMPLTVVGGGVPAAGGDATVYEDFTSIADWTVASGTWSAASGDLRETATTGTGVWITHDTSLSGAELYLEFKAVEWASTAQFPAFMFWASDQTSTADYVRIYYHHSSDFFSLATFRDGTADSETIGSNCNYVITDGNYFGVKVSGTAASATVEIFDNSTSSDWSNRATWATPDCSWASVDLDDVNGTGITRGDYVGFKYYQDATSLTKTDDLRFVNQ